MGTGTVGKAVTLMCILIFGAAQPSWAAPDLSMDPSSRDLLVSKLRAIYDGLAENDPSHAAVGLRLADLLAERARDKARVAGEADVAAHASLRADREAALTLYQATLASVPQANRARVRLQIGHLFELQGNTPDAIKSYQMILETAAEAEQKVMAEAQLAMAEILFKQREYQRASGFYQSVSENPHASSRGLAAYRKAWCMFQLGDLTGAIAGLYSILQTPELLTRGGDSGIISVDVDFQAEVSRDLVTFLSRRPVQASDWEQLYQASPETAKLTNLLALAAELERIGQSVVAIEVWRYIQVRQTVPHARLEGHIRLAQLEMQVGSQRSQVVNELAVREFNAALDLWPSVCGGQACDELRLRARQFVLDWHRGQKKEPPPELLSAYGKYLAIFPADTEMRLWSGQLAVQLKKYPVALTTYAEAIALLRADSKLTVEQQRWLEMACLGAIEAAEMSKVPELLDLAYGVYLDNSLERKKIVEVRYQKAHLLYEKGDYAAAADALKAVALSADPGADDVKAQAADLALDSLVLAKDETRLELWANEFAARFPLRATEFKAIARKSIINQAVALATPAEADAKANGNGNGIANGGAERTRLEQAWDTLARYSLSDATVDEQILYHKNYLSLAEKLEKFAEARLAVDALLRISSLSAADRQYALARKAWLAELVLDFDAALLATEKLAPGEMGNGKKWLKLAFYADLSLKDARPYLRAYLKENAKGDAAQNRLVAARLVRLSDQPEKELAAQRRLLSGDGELLAQVALEVFSQTGRTSVLQMTGLTGKPEKGTVQATVNQTEGQAVNQTPAKVMVARTLILTELSALNERLQTAALNSVTQKRLSSSIKERITLLQKLEALAARAVDSHDWIAQLVTLDRLARESERFYQELMQLPVPQGLSPEDEQQYLALLMQQASPHQVRSQDIGKKVAEFWQAESALEALRTSVGTSREPLRRLVRKELSWLQQAAPAERKAFVDELQSQLELRPTDAVVSAQALEEARRKLREQPTSRDNVRALLTLEEATGREAMVTYLRARLDELRASDLARKETVQ